ncbi:MAG TPA: C-terminal helicase domain-containing protein, partial [Cellulomonas sp.]|nr:C-terminal helicase domain-containing protein [Cellulomonas sp.]
DPQQLPQVSQGTHPFPVDRSALSWLADGHDTLPDELGYFLDRTWRMHPALTAVVSRLSYEDRLDSVPQTADRDLEGVAPGVRVLLVDHEGDAVSSTAEAAVVVEQVRAVVGRRWQDPSTGTDRALTSADVLVVAPYNAQVATVRRALRNAGLDGVEVGTVDKFQGQEAPVAILTTAASSPDDVPRGMEFLLNRNRLNVAISRAQWCAIVVRSRALTDYLPHRPEQLAELGAFLGLADPPT